MVNWAYSSNANNASLWYIVPATDVEVSLNALEGKSYTTAYLPFNATISSDSNVKAYTAALNEAKTMFNLSEVTTLPAATGLLLVDETSAATTATLHITSDEASATSELTGTYFPITLTDTQKTQYLVFGKSNNVAGFYYPGTNLTTIGMNKAYYDNSSNEASSAISLNWSNDVTGINAVTNNALSRPNAPIYDLSGRRVKAPVKGGIYLQAGKKFVK